MVNVLIVEHFLYLYKPDQLICFQKKQFCSLKTMKVKHSVARGWAFRKHPRKRNCFSNCFRYISHSSEAS